MRFLQTNIAGAYQLELIRHNDERGFFARSWCEDEFREHGLTPRLVQCSVSYNRHRGTLRGMHYQSKPYEEAKVVRVTLGAIFDVLLDLRPNSPTFARWQSFELTADNRLSLYIPEGVAHGFQTLSDHTEVFYQMSEFFHPEYAQGVRWNDPHFSITWPLTDPIISERDQSYPLWQERNAVF